MEARREHVVVATGFARGDAWKPGKIELPLGGETPHSGDLSFDEWTMFHEQCRRAPVV